MTLIGALLGASIGLVLGTFVSPNRINVTFALVLTPLLFTGSSQYPWPSLSHIRWFQVVSAGNPMTYVSEGMRAALDAVGSHMHAWVCVLGLLVVGRRVHRRRRPGILAAGDRLI